VNVLHVIPSLSVKEGGPSLAVKVMAKALAREGIQVTIATTVGAQRAPVIGDQLSVIGEETRQEDASTERRGYNETAVAGDPGYNVICFRREFESYKISFGLARWLRKNVATFDLVHVHALFSFSSTMAARIARKNKVPYIVRPLGVLNQWGMQNRRRIPKLASLRLIELPIIFHSAAIHFTSEAEREEAALLDARLAEHESMVIPLPVEQRAWSKEQRSEDREQRSEVSLRLRRAYGSERGQRSGDRESEAAGRERFFAKFPRAQEKRIVLFLSRIDPKKGLELLLDAFAMVRNQQKDVVLVIAGEGEQSYVRELQRRARSLKLGAGRTEQRSQRSASGAELTPRSEIRDQTSDLRPLTSKSVQGAKADYEQDYEYEYDEGNIIWTGHLSGEMKAAALAVADVFVLPSASENFGIAAAESLAAGVPTIVSEEVALSSDIRRYDAGVIVKRDAKQLGDAIGDLLSNRERASMLSANGRRLAEERYSPEAVGKALHELYEHVISKR
jgi:glycosyltransferase involved in cell wall biosynthesis